MISDVKAHIALLRIRAEQGLRDRLRASDMPGRALDVRSDDIFIVSYPKSGNTWVRFLIASLLHPESPTDFGNIDVRCPTIYKTTNNELRVLPGPRVLKSHEYFDPRYPRVINVVRDPRDVLVSYFYYLRRKGSVDADSIERFAEKFMTGRLNDFGTWHENVSSWLAARGERDGFLLVRYEDLLRDGVGELARIAEFLGHRRAPQQLGVIVEQCSFDSMRESETRTGAQSRHLNSKRNDIGFVREGKSGGWKTELPVEVSSRLEQSWGSLIERLGYPITSSRG
ncbi:MAG: sulfotransferase domain-containing protein [Rhodoglobus sp.]